MALVFKDRAMETTAVVSTGAATLLGAVTGYQALSAVGDGSLVDYTIEAVDSNGIPTGAWEVGQGTYTLAGTTLSRTTVYASSNAGSAVNFTSGTKRVFCTLPENRVTQIAYLDTNQTFTGVQTFSPTARTSGAASWLTFNAPADTNQTASTEAIGVLFAGATRQWATGSLTTQRAHVLQAPTYAFVGASTLTTAATLAITGAPIAGTFATITNSYALWVQAGVVRFDGAGIMAGTSAFFYAVDTAKAQLVFNSAGTNVTAIQNDASDLWSISTGTSGSNTLKSPLLQWDKIGQFNFKPLVRTTGSPSVLTVTTPADTTLTASTESISVNLNCSATRQFSTGALTTQRECVIQAPTYSAVGSTTITNAATLAITGAPVQGTNVTISNSFALWVQSGASLFDGTGVRINRATSNTWLTFTTAGATIGYLNGDAAGILVYGADGSSTPLHITTVGSATGYGVQATSTHATAIPFVSRGFASQTGDLQQWQNSGSTVLSRVTAAGWMQNTQGRARLTADVTNATATMSNLTDLSITLIAGRKYTGEMIVKCINSTAAEGIAFAFGGGTATITNFWAGAGVLASGGTDTIGANISTTLAGVINFTVLTGETVITFKFSLVCNAGGTFIPQFSENTSAVGTATARLGSYLWAEDSPN